MGEDEQQTKMTAVRIIKMCQFLGLYLRVDLHKTPDTSAFRHGNKKQELEVTPMYGT